MEREDSDFLHRGRGQTMIANVLFSANIESYVQHKRYDVATSPLVSVHL